MPNYEYECDSCKYTFEIIQSFHAPPLVTCSRCEEDTLHKVFSNCYVHYKGPGFYTTEARGITGHRRRPNIKVGLKKDLTPAEQERME